MSFSQRPLRGFLCALSVLRFNFSKLTAKLAKKYTQGTQRKSSKHPPRSSLTEFLLKQSKSHSRMHAEHRLTHPAHVHFVFFLICRKDLLQYRGIFDNFDFAFKNYRLLRIIRADDASRIHSEVPRLARFVSGAEPNRPVQPQSPN